MSKRAKPAHVKHARRFDTAGWLFWSIVFGLLLAPSIYLLWTLTFDRIPRLVPIGMGAMLAALGAGVITWLVNSAIQWIAAMRRKKAKKHHGH